MYSILQLILCNSIVQCIRGVSQDNFTGFLRFGFCRKLARTKINKAQTKRANITGVQYNSWGSTGIGVKFALSFLLLFIYANSHLPPLPPLHCSCHSLLLPRSVAKILCPIRRARYCCRYSYAASDILGGLIILWSLLRMRPTEPSKPPLPFRQPGHCRHFPAYYA